MRRQVVSSFNEPYSTRGMNPMIPLIFFFALSMWAAWRLIHDQGTISENMVGGLVGSCGFFLALF